MPFVRANDILFDEGLTPEKCALKTLLRWPIKIVNSVHKSKQIKNYSQIISSYYFPVISKFCWLNFTSTSFSWLLQRVVCGSDQRRILSDFSDNLGPTPKNLAKNTTRL